MYCGREDTSQVRLSHDPLKTHASFDDPNLVSVSVSVSVSVPVMVLAERCDLATLVVRRHPLTVHAGVVSAVVHLTLGSTVGVAL
jgi:hypothetical protein